MSFTQQHIEYVQVNGTATVKQVHKHYNDYVVYCEFSPSLVKQLYDIETRVTTSGKFSYDGLKGGVCQHIYCNHKIWWNDEQIPITKLKSGNTIEILSIGVAFVTDDDFYTTITLYRPEIQLLMSAEDLKKQNNGDRPKFTFMNTM